MTKDELKREAFEWTEKNISIGISMYNPSIEMYCAKAYEDSAEPREKQIAELEDEVHTWKEASSANSYKAFQLQEENKILSMHILELQSYKGELADECKDLEVHIEKMKCCENCKHYNQDFPPPFCLNCKTGFNNDYRKRDYWEIKEIKEK